MKLGSSFLFLFAYHKRFDFRRPKMTLKKYFKDRRRLEQAFHSCFLVSPYSYRSRPFLNTPRPSVKRIRWGQVCVYALFYLQFSSRFSLLHLPPQALVLFLFAALLDCLFIFFSFMIFLLLKGFAFCNSLCGCDTFMQKFFGKISQNTCFSGASRVQYTVERGVICFILFW